MEERKELTKNNKKDDGFDWHEEGVAMFVRLVILGWSGAILTLNYITIPGIPQQKIDPTFIASIFTGTLATFGVNPTKKGDNNSNGNGNGNNNNGCNGNKKREEDK